MPAGSDFDDQGYQHPAANHGGSGTGRCTARGGKTKSGTSTDSQPGRPPSSKASVSSKASSRASSKHRQVNRPGRAGLLARLSRGNGAATSGSLSVATSATAGELANACKPRATLADVSRPLPGAPHPLKEFVMAIRGQRTAGKMPGRLPRRTRGASWRAATGSSEGSSHGTSTLPNTPIVGSCPGSAVASFQLEPTASPPDTPIASSVGDALPK